MASERKRCIPSTLKAGLMMEEGAEESLVDAMLPIFEQHQIIDLHTESGHSEVN